MPSESARDAKNTCCFSSSLFSMKAAHGCSNDCEDQEKPLTKSRHQMASILHSCETDGGDQVYSRS